MRYTLVPPNNDNVQLAIYCDGGTTIIRKDHPILCDGDDALVRWALRAPYLHIVELGMTGEEMLAKARQQVATEAAPADEAAPAAPRPAFVCDQCGQEFSSKSGLVWHTKKHKKAPAKEEK
jgi:hypothetical protein